jgi:hypothetical protein
VDNDQDDDEVCDADEIDGCMDSSACNFLATATDDDASCINPTGCETCSGETDGTGTIVDNDQDDDTVCDADEVEGCQDATACNFMALATDEDGTCVYATGCETCSGATDGTGTIVDNDQDDDGVCDEDEVSGCTDNHAASYDENATDDDGSCEVLGCTDNTACNYDGNANTLGFESIRSNLLYQPSTGFGLGAWQAESGGEPVSGFVLADQFQINLEYQPGVLNSEIDAWNNYGEGSLTNWNDPEYYVLTVDPSGGLTAYSYGLDPDASENLEWTITGWGHTILGGYIDGNRLVVSPENTYRPFDATAMVNAVEVFDGQLHCEVVAFTFTGAVESIGDGTQLGVELVSDPAACSTDSDTDGICDEDDEEMFIELNDTGQKLYKTIDYKSLMEALDLLDPGASDGGIQSETANGKKFNTYNYDLLLELLEQLNE